MEAIFDQEPNHRRVIMHLAHHWRPHCDQSMALRYAWHCYKTWKAEKEARELAERLAYFRTFKERKEALRWKILRDGAGRLPVIAREQKEGQRPIFGRRLKGIPYEHYKCRPRDKRVSA